MSDYSKKLVEKIMDLIGDINESEKFLDEIPAGHPDSLDGERYRLELKGRRAGLYDVLHMIQTLDGFGDYK